MFTLPADAGQVVVHSELPVPQSPTDEKFHGVATHRWEDEEHDDNEHGISPVYQLAGHSSGSFAFDAAESAATTEAAPQHEEG